jgi:hypothetical protein
MAVNGTQRTLSKLNISVEIILKKITKHTRIFRFVSQYEDPMQIVYNKLPEWIQLGAKYVGGCCNVGSRFLKNFQDIVKTISIRS